MVATATAKTVVAISDQRPHIFMVTWKVVQRRMKLPILRDNATSKERLSLGADSYNFSDEEATVATSEENLLIKLFNLKGLASNMDLIKARFRVSRQIVI